MIVCEEEEGNGKPPQLLSPLCGLKDLSLGREVINALKFDDTVC